MKAARTLRLEDHVLVVENVRAARLEPSYSATREDGEYLTMVWLRDLSHPFAIRGDHLDVITAAIEAL